MIDSIFTFHPVGQGSFYTGEILFENSRDTPFRMVYDCGSLSNRIHLQSSINAFKRNPHHPISRFNLDVLFLSHLDDDHVNGVKALLTNCICDTIYLPYLTPIERLYVALRHTVNNTVDYDDYIRFIISPHTYLINIESSEIKRIVYLRGNSEGFNVDTNETPDNPLKTDSNSFELIDSLSVSKGVDTSLEDKFLPANVEFKEANNSLYLNDIWEFYIYNELGQYENLEALKTELLSHYGWRMDREELEQSRLEIILNDKEKLAELRKTFKRIFKSHNKTGLVVQHKPIGYSKAHLFKNNYYYTIPHYFNYYYQYKKDFHKVTSILSNSNHYYWGVSLLTGDIGINQIHDSNYIKNHLKDVSVFQVPHHGSVHGWDKGYIPSLSTDKSTTVVINFGYGNKYGHPNPDVLKDLDSNDLEVRFCNQFEGFIYSVTIDK